MKLCMLLCNTGTYIDDNLTYNKLTTTLCYYLNANWMKSVMHGSITCLTKHNSSIHGKTISISLIESTCRAQVHG